MFEEMTVAKMYNLNETIAKDIFEGVTYPWEVLPKISDFIVKLGETLPADEYDKVGENVWIAKSAKVFEQHISTDRQSSEKMQRFATAHLSVAMQL